MILVLGSERLYSDLHRRFDGRRASTEESITVVKLAKSGGCVDRDDAYMRQVRQMQIREYFFGDAKRTLSPHTQLVDFAQVIIYKIRQGMYMMSLIRVVSPCQGNVFLSGLYLLTKIISPCQNLISSREVSILLASTQTPPPNPPPNPTPTNQLIPFPLFLSPPISTNEN